MQKIDMRQRMRATDDTGKSQTLLRGPEAFMRVCDATETSDILLLGLGAYVEDVCTLISANTGTSACDDAVAARVWWLDAPAMNAQRDTWDAQWRCKLPAHWHELILPEDFDAVCTAIQVSSIWVHKQNMHLFARFWSRVWGYVQCRALGIYPHYMTVCDDAAVALACGVDTPAGEGVTPVKGTSAAQAAVLLSGNVSTLLHQELAQAFAACGFNVWGLPVTQMSALQRVGHILRQQRPQLFLSVNMQDMDAYGEVFSLCRACHVPVVVWFVDNPWHILSGVKGEWWKECLLCVTDASFIPALHASGAAKVHHLPLAYAPHMAQRHESGRSLQLSPVVFVGRSSFPAHKKFFAAADVSIEDIASAECLLQTGGAPDFHWWVERLGVTVWPGNAIRCAGLGAETLARTQRVVWLRAALACGLTVYGDAPWRSLIPELEEGALRSPVDYYGMLPQIYAQAAYSLNVTSLLLPAGLTQRHFDVWAAGGFLLTNTTAGLDIFPAELVREVALAGAGQIQVAVGRFERDSVLKRDVQQAWRTHILAAHSYAHRVQKVLEWSCE